MKQLIYGAFKRYNANTKDINKGDCSARAMSLAYGLDYDAVYNELKKLQKSKNRSAYNRLYVMIFVAIDQLQLNYLNGHIHF